MNILQLSERILVNKDWATVLFVLAISVVALNKTIFSIYFPNLSLSGLIPIFEIALSWNCCEGSKP